MAKAKKAEDAAAEKSASELELDHWHQYITGQGFDKDQQHPWKNITDDIEKRIQAEKEEK
jgi:hypothetical protein